MTKKTKMYKVIEAENGKPRFIPEEEIKTGTQRFDHPEEISPLQVEGLENVGNGPNPPIKSEHRDGQKPCKDKTGCHYRKH